MLNFLISFPLRFAGSVDGIYQWLGWHSFFWTRGLQVIEWEERNVWLRRLMHLQPIWYSSQYCRPLTDHCFLSSKHVNLRGGSLTTRNIAVLFHFDSLHLHLMPLLRSSWWSSLYKAYHFSIFNWLCWLLCYLWPLNWKVTILFRVSIYFYWC